MYSFLDLLLFLWRPRSQYYCTLALAPCWEPSREFTTTCMSSPRPPHQRKVGVSGPASLPPGNYNPIDWINRVIFLQSALDSALKSRAAPLLLPSIGSARSPFDPIHINDHFTLFSALSYLFFFSSFSPQKSQQPLLSSVGGWRQSFVLSFECACFLFANVGRGVGDPHQQFTS